MARVIIRHKVKDIDVWKKAFDGAGEFRKSGGEKSVTLGNIHGEPNNLLLVFEWDSIENAKTFIETEELKAAMQSAGVIEEPEIFYVEDI